MFQVNRHTDTENLLGSWFLQRYDKEFVVLYPNRRVRIKSLSSLINYVSFLFVKSKLVINNLQVSLVFEHFQTKLVVFSILVLGSILP